ncbi:MAG: DUF2924 domain-containing protein [bacterium]|nr:DUF2924 domain-containing protein [bacterium]
MGTSIPGQIAALRQMTVAELQGEWIRLYGEPTRSRNKQYLWRRLAWRVQELAHGGLSDAAKAKIDELAPESFTRARTPQNGNGAAVAGDDHQHQHRVHRDPRLPAPGTVITKQYKRRELRVICREDGFEFEGTIHTSLTALAKKITGCTSISGWLFFGLTRRRQAAARDSKCRIHRRTSR